ncbi:MAG: hypothetical protein E7050_05280 [Lentisphaerae bacterium]|nr:hypothetical protein [Lentisphaerota bacterium]
MKKMVLFLAAFVLILFAGGCATEIIDVVSPADISLAELEKRMNAASDPDGLFAASSSYVMRQEVKQEFFLDDDIVQMVEVKFEKPDKIALITFVDNEPSNIFCTDGKRGWIADYASRKIVLLDEKGLDRMQMLASLGRPGSGGYSAVFKDVQLVKCSNELGNFYRLECRLENQEYPIYFYVDMDDYLLRRVKMKVQIGENDVFDYENRIMKYELREGVVIPVETQVHQLGDTQECKVLYYQLNPKFPANDFQPPVF